MKGLLFGDPARYIDDLTMQLNMLAAFYRFRGVVETVPPRDPRIEPPLSAFLDAMERWQKKHGYTGIWRWGPLREASRKLESDAVERVYLMLDPEHASGATPRDRVADRNAQCEVFTLKLMDALRRTASELHSASVH